MTRKAKRKTSLPLIKMAIFVIVGLTAILFFLYIGLRQSVKTKAEDRSQRYCNLHQDEEACKATCTKCDGKVCNYHPELEPWCRDTGCTENKECGGDNPKPLDCPGKEDASGICNPACCDPKNPKTCDKAGETCSLQNGYCKSGYSCAPAKNKVKRTCTQNICAWTSCPPDDSTCCDRDTDSKCMYCMTNEECAATSSSSAASASPQSVENSTIPNGQRAGKCFEVSTEVGTRKEADGFRFITDIVLYSPPGGKDGDVQIFTDGVAASRQWGWNKKENPKKISLADYGTTYLESGSRTVNYGVKIDFCNQLGNYQNITCRFAVAGGTPSVDGPGCQCTNCDSYPKKAPPPPVKPQASSSSSSSAAADKVQVTIAYDASKDSGAPRNGGVCLVKAGGEMCKPLNASQTQQTVSFSVVPTDRSAYTSVRAYLVDQKDHIFVGTAAVNLEKQSEFAVKIDYKR